ncbi:cytochrome c oxidase copper chaperone, putative [Leishmania tarentolae]|uniref:Cytochrome c oxidase copper chaperone, putative n=1 Tax=Leishmania tarentolae TaxID=5689 RepID=A0A640K8F0_LEITA|nr:cytochrome c oxidase copper chaperone, putative [Leishmania tarentolae]
MGNSTSSAGGAAPLQQQSSKTPSCKICCACPQERRARDECTLLKNVDECKTEIESFYACLLKEGFSAEEVSALKRNTKTM